MGLLNRMFGRAEPSIIRTSVPERVGAMTAHEAWGVVAPAVQALDSEARLTMITSGLDMNAEGRSRSWDVLFHLPKQRARVMFSLEPDPAASDVDSAPAVLTRRLQPASDRDAQKPAFPAPFRDSPEVVAEFTDRGADFLAGPGDMKLEGRILPSGEGVWVTYYWDEEFTAPFAE